MNLVGHKGRWQEITINPYSDGEPRQWPGPGTNYVSSGVESYLCNLAQAWANQTGIAEPGKLHSLALRFASRKRARPPTLHVSTQAGMVWKSGHYGSHFITRITDKMHSRLQVSDTISTRCQMDLQHSRRLSQAVRKSTNACLATRVVASSTRPRLSKSIFFG